MQLSLSETLSFFNSQLNIYYTLWVFFFTASIGIAGFLYGNNFARDSLLVKISASIIYLLLILGNHHAISTTGAVLKEVKFSIQNSRIVENESDSIKIDITAVINKLQDSTLDVFSRLKELITDIFYLSIVLFVYAGIWLPGLFIKQ